MIDWIGLGGDHLFRGKRGDQEVSSNRLARMSATIVHYGGHEIQVNVHDAQLVIDAMKGVTRNVSQCVMLSNGWTLVIGPGIPVALQFAKD